MPVPRCQIGRPAIRLSWLVAAGLLWTGATGCQCSRTADQDKPSAEPAGQAAPASPSAPAPGERGFRAHDGTAAGRALGVLVTIDVPRLSGNPACADYERNTRSLFVDLEHQLSRLRARAAASGNQGMPHEELARLVGWLDARAGMLEQIGRAKAMREHELGRVHLELTGAFADLANAFGQAYGASSDEPDPEVALRLGNAADNFAAALGALGAQCSAATP